MTLRTHYMSIYNAYACVPSFSKGGAGVVCNIHLVHVILPPKFRSATN